MRVLLTGGAGYIGSHTCVALVAAGFTPIILDNFSNASPKTITDLSLITGTQIAFATCDLRDPTAIDAVFAAHSIDAVIHFAAFKAVGASMREPLSYLHNNCGGLLNLLSAMERAGVKTLVYSSSATVYGSPDHVPVDEDAPLSFTNPYGYSKLMGEQSLAQIVAGDPEWRIGVLRYFNPAGAHASGLLGAGAKDENIFPRLVAAAMGQEEFTILGDDYPTPDGTGVRDYIHIEDLARGHVASLQALERTQEGHTVNLGTGQGYSVKEVLEAFSAACGYDIPHRIAPRRGGDVAAVYANVERAKDVLKFEAKLGLKDMCASEWARVVQRNS